MDIRDLVRLPVLSVRQPWASYITSGLKSIELRTWATEYRGWIWIHASKQLDEAAMECLGLTVGQFAAGGLMGIAELISCTLIANAGQWATLRSEHRSPGLFSRGVYGWRFRDAIALRQKIDSRGELRLFSLDPSAREHVATELETSAAHREFLETACELSAPGR